MASLGQQKKIGSTAAFFISLLLSPLVGALVVGLSKSLVQEASEQVALPTQRRQAQEPPGLVADELRKLAELRAAGVLSEAQFSRQKARLLGED